jgi:hypothetical protein
MGKDIEVNPGPPVKGLTLIHMNVQSLYMDSLTYKRVKIDEIISTYVVQKQIDIISMSESWLNDQTKDDQIKFPGYSKPYCKDRKDRIGGGVVAYVSENIVSKRLRELEPPDIDLMWIELKLSGKKVLLGVGYRPPRQNRADSDLFLDQFRTSLNYAMVVGSQSIIIMGDFNDRFLKWDDQHELSDLKTDFYDLLTVSDLVQLVTEPTHIASTSESLIDLIITDSPGYVKSVELFHPPLHLNMQPCTLSLRSATPGTKIIPGMSGTMTRATTTN